MDSTHRAHRWLAWVAAWAIMLGALAPTVSHGLRAWHHAPVSWVEVCSSTGTKLIAMSLSDSKAGMGAKADAERGLPAGEHAGEHCPFCLVHAGDQLALLPAPMAAVLAPANPDTTLPRLFLHAPRTLFAWAPTQARAPPTSV